MKRHGYLNRQVKIEDLQEEGVWIGRSRESSGRMSYSQYRWRVPEGVQWRKLRAGGWWGRVAVRMKRSLLFEGCSDWNKSEEQRGWFVCWEARNLMLNLWILNHWPTGCGCNFWGFPGWATLSSFYLSGICVSSSHNTRFLQQDDMAIPYF